MAVAKTTIPRRLVLVCRRFPILLLGCMLSTVVLSSYKMMSQMLISSSSPSLPPSDRPQFTGIAHDKRNHGTVGAGVLPNVDIWKQQSHNAKIKSSTTTKQAPASSSSSNSGNEIAPQSAADRIRANDLKAPLLQQSVSQNDIHADHDMHESSTEETTRGMKEHGTTHEIRKGEVGTSDNVAEVQSDNQKANYNTNESSVNSPAQNNQSDGKQYESHVQEVEVPTSEANGKKPDETLPESESTVNIQGERRDAGKAQSIAVMETTITTNGVNNHEEGDTSAPRTDDEPEKGSDTQSQIKTDIQVHVDDLIDSANKDTVILLDDAITPLVVGDKTKSDQEANTTDMDDVDTSSSNTASYTKLDEEKAVTVEKSHFRKAVQAALKANGHDDITPTIKKHTTAATKKHTAATAEKPTIVSEADSNIKDFAKNPDVVIAVKIHGPPHVIQLKQSLCLLTKAYNNRPNHDILVFVTDPLSNIHIQELRDIVHPAKLTVETDKKTLSRHIREMTPNQTAVLLEQCGKNSTDDLFWWTRCGEEKMPLAYNWQAEFRSKWIWYNKELAKYKWMMWYDSDAMATRLWYQDPVAFAIRNELKILFDHFPQGHRANAELRGMMEDAYNGDYICHVKLVNGHLEASRPVGTGGSCPKPSIAQIHGFFHVTDLDFYRSEANLKWFNNMIGDRKFSREWDDQLAVTVPAAVLAANKSWDMHQNGVWLDVYHNQHFDGDTKRRHRGGGFVHWWETQSKTRFPEAVESCGHLVKNSGR